MIIELISCVGIMWVLRYGSILDRPRRYISSRSNLLKELLNCSLCLGFWCGLIVGSLMYYFNDAKIAYLLFPFCSSACCWFFDSLLDLIQLSCNKLDKKIVDSSTKK